MAPPEDATPDELREWHKEVREFAQENDADTIEDAMLYSNDEMTLVFLAEALTVRHRIDERAAQREQGDEGMGVEL